MSTETPNTQTAPRRQWSIVSTEAGLREWAAAWAPDGLFRAELLANENVGILAARDGERLVGGAVANRSATVIGLSNLFQVADELEAAWSGAAAAATQRWGEMPLVAYDSGNSLAAAHAAGFASTGELVVWLK